MQKKFFLIVVPLLSLFAVGQSTVQSPVPGTATPNAQTQTQSPGTSLSTPHYQADFTPVIPNGVHSISWDKGHLVSFPVGELKELVTFYDRTGKPLFENWLPFDHAAKTYVQHAVATGSETLIVAASLIDADGASADVIAEVANGTIRRAIRTSPFYPLKVCSTGNGIVWAYGKELDDSRTTEPRQDYPMLREYSFEKGQLRSALDRTTVRPPKGIPVGGARQEVQLRCNAQKVVLINGASGELVQYDLSSSQVGRWGIAPLPGAADFKNITGAALTDSGKIYVSTYDAPGQDSLTRILQLIPNTSGMTDWITVTAAPKSDFLFLLGSDGEDLVYARGPNKPTLFWSEVRQAVKK
jgi:hypothetical protein